MIAFVAACAALALPTAAAAAGSQQRSLAVVYSGTGSLDAQSAMICDTSAPDGSPCWADTDDFSVHLTGWSATFDPIVIGSLGALTSQATVGNMLVAGYGNESGQYYDGNSVTNCQGNGTFAIDPASAPAIVTVSPAGSQSAVINVQPPPGLAGNTQQYNCDQNVPPSSSVPVPWPGMATGQAEIGPGNLTSSSDEIDVDQTNPGATQIPRDCTSAVRQHYSNVTNCVATWQFSGKITLHPSCGSFVVTDADGGTHTYPAAPGTSYTAPSSGVLPAGQTVTWGDTVINLAAGSTLTFEPECFTFTPTGQAPGTDLSAGEAFINVICALNGLCSIGDGIAQILPGMGFHARASATTAPHVTYTVSVHGAQRILHLISGAVKLTSTYGGAQVSAGQTVALQSDGQHHSTAWPAADQRLVPAAQRPPSVTGLGLISIHGRWNVRFALAHRAAAVVTLMRGHRTVFTRSVSGRRGVNRVALSKRPAPGRYALSVTATDPGGRVSIAQRTVRLH